MIKEGTFVKIKEEILEVYRIKDIDFDKNTISMLTIRNNRYHNVDNVDLNKMEIL